MRIATTSLLVLLVAAAGACVDLTGPNEEPDRKQDQEEGQQKNALPVALLIAADAVVG